MKNELFNELLRQSMGEAVKISRGEIPASRQFTRTIPDTKKIREKTKLSQKEFANLMQVSERTLQNWEQNHRNPTGPAITLLAVMNHSPKLVQEALQANSMNLEAAV
jgi:putative transcriptional regulator